MALSSSPGHTKAQELNTEAKVVLVLKYQRSAFLWRGKDCIYLDLYCWF